MRTILCWTGLLVLVLAAVGCESSAKLQSEDVDRIAGAWVGTLTYRDFTTDKQVVIPAAMTVAKVGELAAWEFRISYPKEPGMSGVETVALNKDGAMFGDEAVVERAVQPDGVVRFVTEKESFDNRRPALIRYVYLMGDSVCSSVRYVQLKGQKEFFERHRYDWKRPPAPPPTAQAPAR